MKPEKLFSNLESMNEAELLEFIQSSEDFSAGQIQDYLNYIFAQAVALDLQTPVYDCCGTGGDGANTFNISTTAAIIAASCGIRICKNGGRSSSSTTGSVDVIEALGLNLAVSLEQKIMGLEKTNLAFYSNPILVDLLAPIKQICRKHRLTSFISLIGPLASPVVLEGQVIGVAKEKWLSTIVDLVKSLIEQGKRRAAIIVISEFADGTKVDEITSASKSKIILLNQSKKIEFDFDAADLDLRDNKEDLAGGKDHQDNAAIINEILNGSNRNTAKISTVCLNSSLLSYLDKGDCTDNYHKFTDLLSQYLEQAKKSVYSGKAHENFENLKTIYN
ncbi:MAG: hypothetical protein O3C63_06705 [Cyanobacteria bacterium]|nr:hypothetical protein [Cyanobacteriota bacterium]MDA1021118.1 hypothetical protein [Cyanobacteriota bacterium]